MFENIQADYCAIERAYFTRDKTDRNHGTVSVRLMNGQRFEFEGIIRASFYKWQQHSFDYQYAPEGVAFYE